jgi:hypothetical protein
VSATVTLVTESRAVLRIRWDAFDRLTNARGWTWDAERARQLGISDRMLSHMRVGRANPGLKVVNRCVAIFGKEAYDELFEQVEVAEDAA